jgi:hypothetical protein
VEADETFIGGKARNMHFDKRQATIKSRGVSGKAAVSPVSQSVPAKVRMTEFKMYHL